MFLKQGMRNKNKPILFLLRIFIRKSIFIRFTSAKPVSRLVSRRVFAYTGKRHFKLRIRRPFKKYKISSFIPTRIRGSVLKKKFAKVKVKSKSKVKKKK